jgi:hypothetical protein
MKCRRRRRVEVPPSGAGFRSPPVTTLPAPRLCLRYALSHRVEADHSTINRWVQ